MTNKSTIRSAGPSFELLRTRAESDGNGGVVIKWPVVFKLLMALIPLLLATGVSMVWKVSRQQEILNERLTNFMATWRCRPACAPRCSSTAASASR